MPLLEGALLAVGQQLYGGALSSAAAPEESRGHLKAPLLFAISVINCMQLSYLVCCSIYWCLWSRARGAGIHGVCRIPRLGDGSPAFHHVVPHLGTLILPLLWMQRPAPFLPCLSFCFSPRVALCISAVAQ